MAIATSTSPLAALQALGQSVWLDDISRKMLNEGELRRLIEQDSLQGMTSNPTIFQKAISQGDAYNADIQVMVTEGDGLEAIYQALTVSDIRQALDQFRTVYDRTRGLDGYVSLEVSPLLAHDTDGTIREAKELWGLLDRPNAMIKVPGTPEGLPAIEELLYSGINVNVTLLFSVDAYEAVAETYLRALNRRVAEGKPVDHIASVASFFVSRIDAEVDRRIDALLKDETDPARKSKLESLKGRIAIANAKNAYKVYQKLFESPTFETLKQKGARVQRLLWASVGTKNPKYPDTLYTAGLIGPETVSTMPRAAFDAFKDHGKATCTLTVGMDEAAAEVDQLAQAGVSLADVTDQLLREGVKSFADSFAELFGAIKSKRDEILQTTRLGTTAVLGTYAEAVEGTLAELEDQGAVQRLWDKDASLWKSDPDAVKIINNSLGWMTVADTVRPKVEELSRLADSIEAAGFTDVVVMGMGGSSLCVEVFRRTNIPVAGHPVMHVLDSTVPATVRRIEAAIDPAKTLFIVASKSGTTTEPSVFYAYFFDLVRKIKGDKAGENFVAITDPGTKMEADARRDGFRHIQLNPSDIGGRYSALSYFGMLPAAVMGLDVAALLDHARAVIDRCRPETPIGQNPGAALGASLGALALAGRDKVTLVTQPPLEALGLWIEQLVAESTGKEGKGILPVAGESLGGPEVYGDDRVFVQIRTVEGPAFEDSPLLQALSKAGHPVIDLVMADVTDLAAEFFRWEIATPLAGQRLGINPFDQPNVQESKDNTKALLAHYKEKGSLPELKEIARDGELVLSTYPEDAHPYPTGNGRAALLACLKEHLGRVQPGDYVAMTQYFDEAEERDGVIQSIRTGIRDRLKVATTTGYGPRFLHSTGQLHKGGGGNGVFLQLTADDGADLEIPGEPFGFAVLVKAQALGDFQSLASRGRRALNLHLGKDVPGGLKALEGLIREALG